jgi:hypothetical protein
LPLSFEKRFERISGHITHVINIDLSYRFRDNIAIADDRQREATGCRKPAEDNTLFIIIRSVCMKSLKIPKG